MAGKWKRWLRFRTEAGPTRRFFRKSLIMLLLVTSIPGLVTGLIIYWSATDQIGRELQKLHQNQIEQRAEYIDDQLSYLELMLSHWSFDAQFDDKLKHLDFVYHYEQVHDIFRTLLVMEGTHPLINRVELYVNSPKPVVITKDSYQFLDDPAWIEQYNGFLKRDQHEYWTDSFRYYSKTAAGDSSLTLVSEVPGGSLEPVGYLAVSVDRQKLIKLLKTLTPYNEGSTFLMTGNGKYVINSNQGRSADLDAALRDAYNMYNDKKASFLFEHKHTNYSVSYGQFSRLGTTWVYVSAAPLNAITAPVLFVSKLILWISACGLALALVLSWLASHRLYTPIARLVGLLSKERTHHDSADHRDEFELIERKWQDLTHERQSLRSRLEEQMPFMREGFLLQLVQGYMFSQTEKELLERLRHYGWDLEDKQFVAVLVQLNGFSNLEGRFVPGDEDLVTFAAANIVMELSDERLPQYQILNFHDLSFGLLIAVSQHDAGRDFRAELHRLCDEWIPAVNRVLKMRMTISISKPAAQIRQIPFLFESARHALNYGDLHGKNQIIDLERPVGDDSAQGFTYPFALEKEIIQAVRIGSEEEAAQLIGRFLEELAANGSAKLIVQQGMMQLLGSLQHAMLHSGTNPVQLFEGANLFEQLSGLNEPAEMIKWFRYKVVGPYVRELISKQDYQLKQMVEKTVFYLNERYMSADLSLDSCADSFGTSPYTLSRAFKQITGTNFIDYLTNLRIEKAKELLRETDMKINDVAESVSYQHTYFNRIFKKYEGITPSQYRERNRNHT